MTKILNEILAANKAYAEKFGTKGDLHAAPIKKFAILTCMDARLDPAKFAGLSEGDAHVIRNAGGRASDDAQQRKEASKMFFSSKYLPTVKDYCTLNMMTFR